MAQIFGPGASSWFRIALPAALVAALALFVLDQSYVRASGWTRLGRPIEQPIPFSHEHHVGLIGLDCRYCHGSVETSAFAGMPSTSTCMNCHSQVWTDSPLLEPVRASWRTRTPIRWNRVHVLPDFVFFDHRPHVHAGVPCVECHGRVDRMPAISQVHPMLMGWCLDCHRRPEGTRVAAAHEFDPAAQPGHDPNLPPLDVPAALLTRCNTCHR